MTDVALPQIALSAVGKRFGRNGTEAVANFSLDVNAGEFVCILGPSGCGKTTVLRLVDGLLAPEAGSVQVAGKAPRPGPDIGFVFQGFRLIPWLSVRANIAFALVSTALSAIERSERVERYMDLVGLRKFADAYPDALSGGMKQRVALARGFASEPDILLMDEPFASLDAQTRELMQAELVSLWRRRRSTVLFVTHSVDEAILLADRIVLMSPRPGRVVEDIVVDLPRPRSGYDVHATERFIALRHHLSSALRDMVLNDPTSDFYAP